MERHLEDKRRTSSPVSSNSQWRTADPAISEELSAAPVPFSEAWVRTKGEEWNGRALASRPVSLLAEERSPQSHPAAPSSTSTVISSKESLTSPRESMTEESVCIDIESESDEGQAPGSPLRVFAISRRDECYKVKANVMRDIANRLKFKTIDIDCFGDIQMNQASVWWGPQSPVGVYDAFLTSWGKEHYDKVLWFNPPFSRMGEVVAKFLNDRAVGAMMVPYRIEEKGPAPWLLDIMPFAKRRYKYQKGRHVFEDTGPLPWTLCVMWVDSRVRTEKYQVDAEDAKEETFGQIRREQKKWRRKKEREEEQEWQAWEEGQARHGSKSQN